jgi:rRNA-processing protein FCF1
MGKEGPPAVVLDAGALIAFERGDERMRALVREALRTRTRLVIPAGVVGQVFRDGARQARLSALLAGATTEVVVLDLALAEAAGRLCGRTSTSDAIDASVVLVARQARAPVLTSDVGDLRRLDPTLRLERVG